LGSNLPACVARLLLVGLLLAAVAPQAAHAKRRFVPREHRSLQAAIDAAAPGDTIWVAAGVYRGPFVLRKSLVLFGDGGSDSTILDGGDSVRVLLVEGVKGASIIGFGIRRGKAVGGGGIQCVRDTSFTIRDCTLSKNWESAIGVWQSEGVAIGNCRVRENQGSGIRFDHSVGALFGSELTDNQGIDGAGLALVGSNMAVLRETLFERNRAKGATGGGLNLSDTSSATVARCTFRENSTDVAGGGIAVMSGSLLNVSRTLFERNRGGTSGAVQVDHATLNVGYSIFDRNTAAGVAAAIGIVGRMTANVNPILSNNTFFKNELRGDGATLFFNDVSPEVRKNIFVVTQDQRAVTGLKTSPRYDCNLIWDPSGGAIGALPSANTWVGDPLFCDAAHGDFKLRDLSPALRAPCGPIGALSEKAGCASFRLQPAN
jgi:hypothetical protein